MTDADIIQEAYAEELKRLFAVLVYSTIEGDAQEALAKFDARLGWLWEMRTAALDLVASHPGK